VGIYRSKADGQVWCGFDTQVNEREEGSRDCREGEEEEEVDGTDEVIKKRLNPNDK